MNMRDIDLNLLLVFEAIYASGNISRAADRLDLSQPALSNALARLRGQLDDQLFVRSGNGVVATARAEELIGPIRQALDTIRHGLTPQEHFDPRTSENHFRLLLADPLERIVVADLVAGLERECRLSFELVPPQTVQIEEALLGFNLDLTVFLLPSRHPELNTQPLCPVDMVLIARKDHPRIRGEVTPEIVQAEKLVGLSLKPGKLKNSEKLTVWQRVAQHPFVQVHKASSIAQIVAKTDTIGYVSAIYARQFAEGYGLQVIQPAAQISNQQFHLIWHKRYEDDPAHVWLRTRVTEAVEAARSL